MLVASDTSPISSLAIIDRLDLLRSQFQEIWIPGAVEMELREIPHPLAVTRIEGAIRSGWIRPRAVGENRVIRLLRTTLHPGESEAIALAVELGADLVLMDEREGRSAAERVGLHVTGVLGILLRAKKAGDISLLKPEIEALRREARFFVAARLEEELLRGAGELPGSRESGPADIGQLSS
jgi:hypothetical protein